MYYDEYDLLELIDENLNTLIAKLPNELSDDVNDKLSIQNHINQIIDSLNNNEYNTYLKVLKEKYKKYYDEKLSVYGVYFHLLNETDKLIGMLRITREESQKDNLLSLLYLLTEQLSNTSYIDMDALKCVSYCKEIKNKLLLQEYKSIPTLLSLLYCDYKKYVKVDSFYDLNYLDDELKQYSKDLMEKNIFNYYDNLNMIKNLYQESLKW